MRTLVLAAVVMVPGAAAAAPGRLDPAGATDAEALRGNVLVWADATFYAAPADDAPAVHAASLPGARKDAVGEVVAMHVVSVAKGFVEVEPAAELDCTWSRLQTTDDVAHLRLFVKRADLAPVLVQPFAQTYDDGSAIALRPGMPVVPTTDGTFAVGVRGGEVVVALPAAAVGHAYTPDKTKPAATSLDREYELAPKAPVTLDGRAFVLEGHRASSIEPRGERTRLSITTRCAALDVLVSPKAVHAVDADDSDLDVSSGLGVLDLRDHDYIPAGTPLATPNGRVIAAAARPIYLMSAPHGKTACVDRRVRVGVIDRDALDPKDGDDKLRLCAPAARVIHERMRSASSANGTTHR